MGRHVSLRRWQRGGAESPKQGPSGVFSGFSEVLGRRSVQDGQGSGVSWMGQARRKTRRRVGGDSARDPCGYRVPHGDFSYLTASRSPFVWSFSTVKRRREVVATRPTGTLTWLCAYRSNELERREGCQGRPIRRVRREIEFWAVSSL